MTSKLSIKTEAELADALAGFYSDPMGFVMFAYPWGEATLPDGSANPLAEKKGPEPWQARLFMKLAAHILENIEMKSIGLDYKVWRSARASGHGIGKSAVVAWLIQFFMSTRRDTRIVVTANTSGQLQDKTWPELAKWHKLLINRHWFEWTATTYYFKLYPEDQRKNYMATAATVSEQNTEAFAGLHNETGTVVVIFDEASGIIPKIWEVAEGALTDGEGFFFAFGNPTRPEGEFADCFDKHAHLYDCEHIDSREVSHTNKSHINDLINKYGEDSDEVKIRVKGQFPSVAYNGFIMREAVEAAIARELHYDPGAALIMAVDPARFGGDEIVIGWRQGRDARSRTFITTKGLSTTKLAELVAQQINATRPDAVVIESTGLGAGLIDILRDKGYRIVEVHPGSPSSEPQYYFNKRCELWAKMRDWIYENGCMYDDPEMIRQLTAIQYELDRHEQRVKLEAKEAMKERTGLSSPDRADTLALTFAVKLARRDANNTRRVDLGRQEAITDYDPVTY